jgi:hypothetical protein
LFLEWVNATVEENRELEDFDAERFRPEFNQPYRLPKRTASDL